MGNPWDNDAVVTPAPAAAGGNPWDNDAVVTPAPTVSPAQQFRAAVGRDPSPYELQVFQQNPGAFGPTGALPTALQAGNALASGANSNVADIAGLPVDTARQVLELGKAAVGAPYTALTGKVAADFLQPNEHPENDVGGSAWIKQQARNAGQGALVDAPNAPGVDGLHTFGEVVGPIPAFEAAGALRLDGSDLAAARAMAPKEPATPP